MSLYIQRNFCIVKHHFRTITTGWNPTNKLFYLPFGASGYQTSFRCYGDTSDGFRLVNHVEKTVKSYGYLELSNLDLDVKIKPACPNIYPDMNRAVCNFYSKTEHISPNFIKTEEKLSVQTEKSYQPNESHCSIEIPIKYGMKKVFLIRSFNLAYLISLLVSDVDSANIMGKNSVQVESLESGSIRITTGSGDITSKSIKGDFISLLSQSGNIKCLGLSQGRITIHTGSGVNENHQ